MVGGVREIEPTADVTDVKASEVCACVWCVCACVCACVWCVHVWCVCVCVCACVVCVHVCVCMIACVCIWRGCVHVCKHTYVNKYTM